MGVTLYIKDPHIKRKKKLVLVSCKNLTKICKKEIESSASPGKGRAGDMVGRGRVGGTHGGARQGGPVGSRASDPAVAARPQPDPQGRARDGRNSIYGRFNDLHGQLLRKRELLVRGK